MILFHQVGTKLKDNILEITGFSAASTMTTLHVQDLLNTALSAAVVAVVSGFIGAFVAHFTKKLIQKLKL